MSSSPPPEFGLWELAVLCVLREGPMHPYEIQRLLRERHKAELLVLKPGSLYHAIRRLVGAGLIETVSTERKGRRPERTTYRITRDGHKAMLDWLRRMIAVPRREGSEFMTAVSFLVHLPPDEAARQLEQRATVLEAEVDQLGRTMSLLLPRVTRVNLLEEEYLQHLCRAELKWVRGIAAELRTGKLGWDVEQILSQVRAARQGIRLARARFRGTGLARAEYPGKKAAT